MKTLKIFVIGLIVIGVWIAQNQKSPAPQQTTTSPSGSDQIVGQNKVKVDKNVYARRAVDNNWPKLSDDSQAVVIDDELNRKNYYLVFDGSGSMRNVDCSQGQPKISVAKQAVQNFIDKIPVDANIGMAVFDGRGLRERLPLAQVSRQAAKQEVAKIEAESGTPLYSSITMAYQALNKQATNQLGYGEYHLVVITDGEASKGEDPTRIVNTIIQNSPIVVHTIGFCISGNHSLNQAGQTLYRSASNPADLARGLDSVLAEASDFSSDQFEGVLK